MAEGGLLGLLESVVQSTRMAQCGGAPHSDCFSCVFLVLCFWSVRATRAHHTSAS